MSVKDWPHRTTIGISKEAGAVLKSAAKTLGITQNHVLDLVILKQMNVKALETDAAEIREARKSRPRVASEESTKAYLAGLSPEERQRLLSEVEE